MAQKQHDDPVLRLQIPLSNGFLASLTSFVFFCILCALRVFAVYIFPKSYQIYVQMFAISCVAYGSLTRNDVSKGCSMSSPIHSLQRWIKALRPTPPHLSAVAVHYESAPLDPLMAANYGRLYQQSPAVYLAVNRIVEAGALVPLNVFRVQGEERISIKNHPLERLLEHPNPFLSRFELLEQTLGFLELYGNAYWFIAGDAGGLPAEVWVLRPDRISIVPDAQRGVKGYVYEIDGQRIPLRAEEVVHFKRWHPGSDYYGLSALEAGRLSILSDRAMAQWNYNTFGQDNGVPAGIVNIQDFVSDSDFDRIQHEWRTSYGSGKRRTAFLRGGAVTWQNIGLQHSELDFLNGRKAQREEILNIFGIPAGLVSENATEANAKVAERMFIQHTLYPKLVRIAQKITQELLPFYPGEHVAAFEDIRPTDVQARLAEIQAAQQVMSINEIRQTYYALPTVVWGERPPNWTQPLQSSDPTPPVPSSLGEEGQSAKSVFEELAQWERFALRRLDKPQQRPRPFSVSLIPDEIAFEVSAGLLFAPDRETIKAVFAEARETLE